MQGNTVSVASQSGTSANIRQKRNALILTTGWGGIPPANPAFESNDNSGQGFGRLSEDVRQIIDEDIAEIRARIEERLDEPTETAMAVEGDEKTDVRATERRVPTFRIRFPADSPMQGANLGFGVFAGTLHPEVRHYLQDQLYKLLDELQTKMTEYGAIARPSAPRMPSEEMFSGVAGVGRPAAAGAPEEKTQRRDDAEALKDQRRVWLEAPPDITFLDKQEPTVPQNTDPHGNQLQRWHVAPWDIATVWKRLKKQTGDKIEIPREGSDNTNILRRVEDQQWNSNHAIWARTRGMNGEGEIVDGFTPYIGTRLRNSRLQVLLDQHDVMNHTPIQFRSGKDRDKYFSDVTNDADKSLRHFWWYWRKGSGWQLHGSKHRFNNRLFIPASFFEEVDERDPTPAAHVSRDAPAKGPPPSDAPAGPPPSDAPAEGPTPSDTPPTQYDVRFAKLLRMTPQEINAKIREFSENPGDGPEAVYRQRVLQWNKAGRPDHLPTRLGPGAQDTSSLEFLPTAQQHQGGQRQASPGYVAYHPDQDDPDIIRAHSLTRPHAPVIGGSTVRGTTRKSYPLPRTRTPPPDAPTVEQAPLVTVQQAPAADAVAIAAINGIVRIASRARSSSAETSEAEPQSPPPVPIKREHAGIVDLTKSTSSERSEAGSKRTSEDVEGTQDPAKAVEGEEMETDQPPGMDDEPDDPDPELAGPAALSLSASPDASKRGPSAASMSGGFPAPVGAGDSRLAPLQSITQRQMEAETEDETREEQILQAGQVTPQSVLTPDDTDMQSFIALPHARQRERINAWGRSGGTPAQKKILRWWVQRGGQSASPSPASPAHAELEQFKGMDHDQQAALISEYGHLANTPGRRLILAWWQHHGGMSASPSPGSTGFIQEKARIKQLEGWIKKFADVPQSRSAVARYRAERDRLVARIRGQKRKKGSERRSEQPRPAAPPVLPVEEPRAKREKVSKMHYDSELGFPGANGQLIEGKLQRWKKKTKPVHKRIFGNIMPWRVVSYMAWKSNNSLTSTQLRTWMPELQGIYSMAGFRHFLTGTFRDWLNQRKPSKLQKAKAKDAGKGPGRGKSGQGFELRSSQIRKMKDAPAKKTVIKKPTPAPAPPIAPQPRQKRQYFI